MHHELPARGCTSFPQVFGLGVRSPPIGAGLYVPALLMACTARSAGWLHSLVLPVAGPEGQPELRRRARTASATAADEKPRLAQKR